MGNAITLTEDQIKSLPEEQQKLVREALEKAKAAAGAAPSGGGTPTVDLGAIASQAQGLISSLLKQLTPEQQKMLEDAQKSGKLPEGFAEMLLKGAVDPAIVAKLTPEQRDALQKVIASGELSAEAIKDLIGEVDVATVKEVAKSVVENKPIDINKVKSVVTKVAKLVCTNGKKKITVNAKRCPAGFKKG
jgi:DNA-binding MarR family transcriptional regulator